ncbi:MAG: hypothetical protein NT166_26640 [Candidatus Aminicenantes bacterium]|nr:hypothetical protein [Candidatus Aminicenantes bacterium]
MAYCWQGTIAWQYRDVVVPVFPSGLLWGRRLRISQVSRKPTCTFARVSDPVRTSTPDLFGASVLPPLF